MRTRTGADYPKELPGVVPSIPSVSVARPFDDQHLTGEGEVRQGAAHHRRTLAHRARPDLPDFPRSSLAPVRPQ
ncbi:MAG: hypothetical protein R2789_15020 [Microthrixaceae bacterium]